MGRGEMGELFKGKEIGGWVMGEAWVMGKKVKKEWVYRVVEGGKGDVEVSMDIMGRYSHGWGVMGV